jgi:gliding motility-associated-like protein
VVTISRDITYRVQADNPGGCPATAEVVVEPICLAGDVFIPNTFSPNGDGRNDRFYPMGRAVSGIKSMRVFNRWGEMVFEKTNFNANDPSAGWDGTYKGKLLTPDVYVYVVVVLCHNAVVNEIKGNVTLLR